LLSRLNPGAEFYYRRFRVERVLDADPIVLTWLVYDQDEKQRRVLLEYLGAAPSDRKAKREFVSIAKQLQSLSGTIVPVLSFFTWEDRFYLLLAYEEHLSLKSLLTSSVGLSEERIREIFTRVLDALECLHSQTPFLFHGNLSLDNVLLTNDGAVLLKNLWCPVRSSSMLADKAMILADNAIWGDLKRTAVIAAELLCKTTEGAPEPPPKWEKVVSAAGDMVFAATLEWILGDASKRPGSVADVRGFSALVRRAHDAEAAGHVKEAVGAYDQAYKLAPIARLRTVLDRLKPQVAKGSSVSRGGVPDSDSSRGAERDAQRKVSNSKTGSGPNQTSPRPSGQTVGSSVTPATVNAHQANSGPARATKQEISTRDEGPAARLLLKKCPTCGSVFHQDSLFCEYDGTKLESVTQVAKANSESRAQVDDVAPPGEQFAAPQDVQIPSRTRTKVVAAGGVILIFLMFYILTGSLESDFNAALRRGNLVSTSGRSAYAIYLEALRKEGPDSKTVRSMNQKVQPVLENWSREIFQSWYRNSELGKVTWEDVARVQEWLDRINSTPETKARLKYATGMAAFVQRDFQTALQRFSEALQYSPRWPLCLNALGRCYFNLNRFQLAEQYYQQAAAADPAWSFPLINLANLYRDVLRRDDAAEMYYKKAIALDPTRRSFHYALATLYYRKGKSYWTQACREYRSSLESSGSGMLTAAESDIARQRIRRICE
jgi:hypothetical protein